MAEASNYDPPEHERRYYRNRNTHERAYLVRRGGEDHIRLDRTGQEITKKFQPHEWEEDREHRPVSRMQLATVAYAADLQLCQVIGLHHEARRVWGSLKDEERIAFKESGPKGAPVRKRLYAAIMGALEGLEK
jgi:hypothetical protein